LNEKDIAYWNAWEISKEKTEEGQRNYRMEVSKKTAHEKSKRPLIRSKHNMFRFRPTRDKLFVQKVSTAEEPNSFKFIHNRERASASVSTPIARNKATQQTRSSSVRSRVATGEADKTENNHNFINKYQ
jgi:hypothetical protein